MTDYITPSDELDAINILLGAIQEAPITSLDEASEQSPDAQTARNYLQREHKTLLKKGWVWNTDIAFPLTPDANGQVDLPAGLLKLDNVENGFENRSRYVARGLRLYDRVDHTYNITNTDLTADVVVLLDFPDIPEAARDYIVKKATRKFQIYIRGESSVMRFEEAEIQEALADLIEGDLESDDTNMLYGSEDPSTLQAIGRFSSRRSH